MSETFDRILASLHEVALDPAHWSTATALSDEALRAHGSSMVFGDGRSEEDIRIYFGWDSSTLMFLGGFGAAGGLGLVLIPI